MSKEIAALAILLASSAVAQAANVDYTTVADGTYASVSLGGTTVTGSNTITSSALAGVRGLGVTGGGGNSSLDLGETMTIDFGGLASNILVTINDISPPGNVTFGFRAFDGMTELGLFAFPNASSASQVFNVSALAGGLSMTRFRIELTASAPLGLQIQGVSFDRRAVPEPGTLALLGLGLVALGAARRRRA